MTTRSPILYVQLDVNYFDDPKLTSVSSDAELLFVRSLCLSKRLLSDGFIANGSLYRYGTDIGTDPLDRGHVFDLAAELVKAGLWEEAPDGYLIAAWDKHNASAEEVHEKRRKKSEGGLLGNHRRWHADKPSPDCRYCSDTESVDRSDTESAKEETETEEVKETGGTAHARTRETNPNGTPRTWDQDWREVSAAVRGGSNRPIPDNITGRARAAVQRLGGMRQIGSLDPKSAKFDFRDAWKEVGNEQTV